MVQENKRQFEEKAKTIYNEIKKEFTCQFDRGGSIGRRYARQDEIATPYCVTIDEPEAKTVTIRQRDTAKQIRINTNM